MERGIAPNANYIFDHDPLVADEEDGLHVMMGFNNTDTFVNASIYYNKTPWNNIRQRKMKKVTVFHVKRYCKRNELIQKDTVAQMIGSRVSRLLGTGIFEEAQDPGFQDRLKKSITLGITRDEISIYRASGLLENLKGRSLNLDEVASFIRTIKATVHAIRRPLTKP